MHGVYVNASVRGHARKHAVRAGKCLPECGTRDWQRVVRERDERRRFRGCRLGTTRQHVCEAPHVNDRVVPARSEERAVWAERDGVNFPVVTPWRRREHAVVFVPDKAHA